MDTKERAAVGSDFDGPMLHDSRHYATNYRPRTVVCLSGPGRRRRGRILCHRRLCGVWVDCMQRVTQHYDALCLFLLTIAAADRRSTVKEEISNGN